LRNKAEVTNLQFSTLKVISIAYSRKKNKNRMYDKSS